MAAESPYFFLSYARGHFDTGSHPHKWIVKFFRDLCADIAELTGSPTPGYMDKQRLEIGTRWPFELTDALATCKVLLPIFSPQYFTSDYCGKEWEIFSRRITRHPWGDDPPKVIIPVHWTPMEIEDLPEMVRHVQHRQADLPQHYQREGLYGIMRLGKYREAYKETVLHLARAIVKAAGVELTPLDESERVPPHQIPSAFTDVKAFKGGLDDR
ncbi:TIR-like protein FxsC [Actinocorallia longicatena]|uniref:TIR domain-containing protein n=1 Tax=Actinocorallia longicatena TaxID=111803 RepID=A0ABP6Q241_9ACTN